MHKLTYQAVLFLFFISQIALAQQPAKPNSTELYNQIKKLNFLGSVLYLAAHPDDENTRLISYMSNEQKARTGYLSLTRGDGGQNLIGTELREQLGVIRTQELIEARKIDGGEQFFTRANDFGFSKVPDETLAIWNKEQVLSDIIWTIRKFQPDVIINRFDHRSPGTTHGHHTSSAMLSVEAFDLANNKNTFPDQLKLVDVWQPKRLLFNVSWWFYGGKDKFDKADKSKLIHFKTGVYYPELGKSNQEIAALSRSRHQSQGFGSTGSRGDDIEYLDQIKGDKVKDETNLFEGIDTSWNRVKGGNAIGEIVTEIEKNFDFKNPSASIPSLVKAYTLIQNLEDKHWKEIKTEEIKKIIAGCAGLYLEAVSETQSATPGSTEKLNLEAINRCITPIKLIDYTLLPQQKTVSQNLDLKNNEGLNIETLIEFPENTAYTEPYWLKEQGTLGMYRVDNQELIGIPDIIRTAKVVFKVQINDVTIPFERPIVYKYNDEVKGEVYKPFDIVPDVTSTILDKVKIFNDNTAKTIGVQIKAGKDNVVGQLHLEAPADWKITPQQIPFSINKKDGTQTVYFEVTPPVIATEATLKSIATLDNKSFNKEQIIINYSHIAEQQILKPSEARLIKLDIKIRGNKIAYIMGAGDNIPESLGQMGYLVEQIKPEEINSEKLTNFDAVIVGIRAYNTVESLAFKQNILFDYVKKGGTMIVQYNTNGRLITKNIAPYPLKISNYRVTDENAEVRFLVPNHKVLNFPNKITSNDFKGWVQEQGLYYPDEWSKEFEAILSSNDDNESPKNGALLIAAYGKGHYIYTGLSFFRELPVGIAGAYRLMANLIAIDQPEKI
ncbi:PIG-L family deacetylase [Flavobacterium sp. '19STA2R22 D10 B1']|uniref:PIG-L family deacetylase n=1 Tax=Flavobacterium aerium TaxID=3037261 RepID=UPI00278BDCE1|nr:PIG-L family deacetylase [Flavobacterium sp. '19STA2R22 D10 B1']